MRLCRTIESVSGSSPRFAVLGAGNGGLAMAAHLALKGFEVRLYNRSRQRIEPLLASHTIQIVAHSEGDLPHGKARISLITADIEEAIRGADIIMVVVPATGHADIAQTCAPFLSDGQLVVLNPGRTGGALEFLHVIRGAGCTCDVIVAESQTLLYACRAVNIGQVQLFAIKNSVPVASIPAYRIPDVVRRLAVAFPEFVPGDNVMKTSLDNIGAVFHPAVTVLNSARIETTRGEFEYYIEGISRSVAQILEVMDAERVAVAAALGFRCVTAREWLYLAYGATGKTLFDAVRANQGYYGISAPTQLAHRYITEDVPMSLVPIASLGEYLGVSCPTIRSIIHLAGLLHDCDYWQTGRNVNSLGFAGLTLQQIRRKVHDGRDPEKTKPPRPRRRKEIKHAHSSVA